MLSAISLQQCSPFIGFGKLLYHLITVIDQFFKIRIEIKFIEQFTDPAIRSFKIDNINHNSAIINWLKIMLVFK